MENISEGRIVHYQLAEEVCRPALIVNAHGGQKGEGVINILIFMDGNDDLQYLAETMSHTFLVPFGVICWGDSINFSEDKTVGTWHWPERK